jgi:transcriptional regulator with XRE-family HTH domain
MSMTALTVGPLLRDWRQRRRMSQLELALEADVSTRHLSFIETGRSQPSREMLLALAERLDVPLRERNVLLTAAGFAPVFGERPLDDPEMEVAREAIDLVLRGHEPYPAIAIDRRWILRAANATATSLLSGVEPSLIRPPVNVLRLSLHPQGLAPRIANLDQWRGHLLDRLRRQIDVTADAHLATLLDELRSYGRAGRRPPAQVNRHSGIIVPLVLDSPVGRLAFLSTTTVFGTPIDVTLSELAIEAFFPADRATAERVRRLAPD